MDAVNLEGVWLMGKKIPVPAPLVPRRSQGGVGVYPWWRIDEICKNPIEQDADRILDENTVYSEDQKGLPPQVPSLEEWTLREELRRIRKHLGKVKGEIIHLRSRDKGARSEMRRKDEELESLRKKLDRLTRKILKLQRSKKQSILELPWMMPIAPTTVQPQAAAPPPQPEVVKEEKDVVSVPAAEAPSRLDEFEYETRLAEIANEGWNQRLRALLKALPWAAGSIGVYLMTSHLVPKKNKVLKAVGYAVSGALGAVAVYRGLSEMISNPTVPPA